MQWYTTPPVTIEHALCIWLVRSFVDTDAHFEVVPRANGSLPPDAKVLGPTSKPGGIVRQYKLSKQGSSLFHVETTGAV